VQSTSASKMTLFYNCFFNALDFFQTKSYNYCFWCLVNMPITTIKKILFS
jgi:hypothetical protein